MRNSRVAVDAAVAQKRPIAAHVFKQLEVTLADKNFFFVVRSLRNDAAERIAQEGAAPELQALTLGAISANIAELMSHTVHHADEHAVSNGMGTLDRPPGVMLGLAEFSFLVRMPADGRWIEKNVCALE